MNKEAHGLEHIGKILPRAIATLAKGWKQQRKEGETQHERRRRALRFDLEIRGVTGFGQPGAHTTRSPFALVWGELSEIKKKR